MDSNSEVIFRNVFINSVGAADDYSRKADNFVSLHSNNIELQAKLEQSIYGKELLAGAHSFMQSGFNSFQTLRLAVLPNGLEPEKLNGTIQVRVSINGVAGLLRQAMECLAKAEWLLQAKNLSEIEARGFAFLWSNSENRLKYERALGSSRVEEIKQLMVQTRKEGIALGLFETKSDQKDGYASEPRVKIADSSGLLRKLRTNMLLPDEVIAQYGPGFENAEWLYVWLSGFTHGLEWIHKNVPLSEVEDVALIYRIPDFQKFATASVYVIQLVQIIFELCENPLKNSFGIA